MRLWSLVATTALVAPFALAADTAPVAHEAASQLSQTDGSTMHEASGSW